MSKEQAKKPLRIVCRCNDVTEEEIIKAIKAGFNDIESLKRATLMEKIEKGKVKFS
ncbi:MAG: hypothetical protein B6U76_06510 [Desulfurococcales archaeon ex4484_217_2]|nr:MAG: hypothetical protein B6U76_06510 [Desulfurococcales archaeon ex4484_217_2]